MKTTTRLTMAVLAMMLTLGFWTLVQSWEGGSTGGPLHRLSADFKNFDGTETSTILPPDGQLVYRKTVSVPSDHNVLYVNITATGDEHDGAAMWMNCRVDGNDCNPGTGGAGGAPAGWVPMQKMPSFIVSDREVGEIVFTCDDGGGGFGDCHDNNFNYTWCTPIAADPWSGPISHDVELRMATSEEGKRVFFEAAHFYIDSNAIDGNACEPAEPVPGETADAAAAPSLLPKLP